MPNSVACFNKLRQFSAFARRRIAAGGPCDSAVWRSAAARALPALAQQLVNGFVAQTRSGLPALNRAREAQSRTEDAKLGAAMTGESTRTDFHHFATGAITAVESAASVSPPISRINSDVSTRACQGPVYLMSGRIRNGPAPASPAASPQVFLSDTKVKIG